MRWIQAVVWPVLLAIPAVAGTQGLTDTHEKGRCAIRGECGKESFFGKQLPCPDNGLAKIPTDSTRQKLVDLCGEKWSEGDVCCDDAQVNSLGSSLKQAYTFISACPACKENFYNLFCTFTCSPDQSLFVNVTEVGTSTSRNAIVTELDTLWSNDYGKAFYSSCKDVKFGATGGLAMDFIGGGAQNYTEFLSFLGEKKFIGSPFQINFPRPEGKETDGMKGSDLVSRACNDEDERFRCACVDCPATCAELPKIEENERCYVGLLPCLSFSAIIVYSVFLALFGTMIVGHVMYRQHSRRQSERLQLLQDIAPSDDEDEGDIVQNAGMLDRPQRNYKLNSILDEAFAKLGSVCARYPLITIMLSLVVVFLLSLGWLNWEVENDPARLWVSPSSSTAQEKAFFDENFGPFYRAEQVFLVNDTLPTGPGPVLSWETLSWWADVEKQAGRITPSNSQVILDDICFKPTGDACATQSILGYFSKDTSLTPSTWEKQIKKCTSGFDSDCLPAFQQPLSKEIVLGGWKEGESILSASAVVTTWVVNNGPEGSLQEIRAKEWEKAFQVLLTKVQHEAKERGLRLSYSTEISLEQELNKSSNTDAKIVVISYIVMFIYVSLALGSTTLSLRSLINNPAIALVQSKFSLGISGIIIVLMSVSASVGLFSAVGIKVTLIIAEVIPFLVLAVGVDNIFLIVHEFERLNVSHPDESIDGRMAKALGRMGPSILLSASTETIAFALGIFVGMPAVRNFAFYAAGAIVINALLQVTMFVSVLALNQRRVESGRVDCFPIIKIKRAEGLSANSDSEFGPGGEGALQQFIRKTYAPALLGRKVRVAVVVAFLGLFTAGVSLIPEVSLGLDQRIAIPEDSYLIPYFNDLYDYFDTGPPVYFVTKDLNITARAHQEEVCGRFGPCHDFSLASVLELEGRRSNVSYIFGSPASWVDDFLFWLNPAEETCCLSRGEPCFENRSPGWSANLEGMPEGKEFIDYAAQWLASSPSEACPIAGKAAYGTAVVIDANHTTIPASHFRTAHTPLRSQEDFIAAYASARRIADTISSEQNITVFPYSKFYIFFDQYVSIVALTARLLGAAIALILIVTSLLLGSIATGCVVTFTVVMIIVDIIGTMAIAGVSLNAISLVNLVICVGISVEFCAHIARAFMFPSRSVLEKARNKFRGKEARAWASLVNVGASVFSGITITKLLGVSVLAFTKSKIFEVYYFRIWLALVCFAALHALIFLPVALSFAGGDGYIDPELEGGLEEDLASRRYRALIPDDEDDSDEY